MKDWCKKYYVHFVLVGLVAVVGGVAAFFYINQFGANGFSKKSEDWANFATYISGTVGVAAVVATLIAFVITLRQQQDLVESQRVMLEKQKEQLKIEYEKKLQVVVENEKRERRTAIYLLHQFETLDKFYWVSHKALIEKNPKIWLALAKKNPSTYPSLLLNETADLLSLINHINGKMTLDCLGAVNLATELSWIFETTLSEECLSSQDFEKVKEEIGKLDFGLMDHAKVLVQAGGTHCKQFLVSSRAMLEKEKQLLITEA
ncbi:MAG: hypothetical protein COA87_000535 [Halomonas sp.]|nr:hypothetical protein [Halomonas sp.]MBL1266257.1 hypothetical protein [Halomonas sp.]